MPKKLYKKKWFLPLTIVPLLFLSYLYIFYKDYKLKKNFILTEGVITEFHFIPKGTPLQVKYNFTLGDKTYYNESILNVNRNRRALWACLLMDKKFPIIYQKDNPSNSQMLLTLSDYRKYRITIPFTFLGYASYLDSVSKDGSPESLPDTNCYKSLYLKP